MTRRKLKHLLILFPTSVALVVGFSNCGQSFETKPGTITSSSGSNSNSNSSEGGGSGTNPTTTPPTNSGGTPSGDNSQLTVNSAYAIMTGDQTLTSMLKVTGMVSPTDEIMAEYKARYSAFAGGSEITRVTSPVLLASTSLAGEICSSLVKKEKSLSDSQRLFFSGINFPMGSANISDSSYQTAIRSMARSFWVRNENSDELATFQTFRNEFEGELTSAEKSQAASAEKLMITTCAAVLSTLDAIVF